MNPIFDQAGAGNHGGGASSLSFSATIGDLGGHGLIIVGAGAQTTVSNFANGVVTGITFNGIAMTAVKNDGNNGGSFATREAMFELRGANCPGPGTYTVVVTYAGSTDSQAAGYMSFKNVRNQAAEATASTGANGGGSMGTSVTTLTPNALLVSIYASQNNPNATSTTGDTRAFNSIPGSGESMECDGFYRIVQTPASSSVTLTTSNPESQAVSLASYAAQPAPNFLPFL